VTSDKAANIAAARAAVAGAAAAGARLVVLPEMWNCPYSNDSFPPYAEDFSAAPSGGAPSFAALSEAAASAGVTLVGGSVPERDGGKLYNTCCVFGPDGKLLAKHRCGGAAGGAGGGGGGLVAGAWSFGGAVVGAAGVCARTPASPDPGTSSLHTHNPSPPTPHPAARCTSSTSTSPGK
jgi:hypothetical protein